MQRLRNAAFLARLVLAWFVVSIGVAVAAPLVKPQSMELICSGGGAMKLLVKSADGKPASPAAKLDCPLCASLAAPPPAMAQAVFAQPLGHVFAPIVAARIAALTGAPLPARGPPASDFA